MRLQMCLEVHSWLKRYRVLGTRLFAQPALHAMILTKLEPGLITTPLHGRCGTNGHTTHAQRTGILIDLYRAERRLLRKRGNLLRCFGLPIQGLQCTADEFTLVAQTTEASRLLDERRNPIMRGDIICFAQPHDAIGKIPVAKPFEKLAKNLEHGPARLNL